MKPKLSLKTLYRSPVRTVLTFMLIAVVTFALVSQVLEYTVAMREMEKAIELYDGVLNVESGAFFSEGNELPAYIYADERVPQGSLSEDALSEYRKSGYEYMTSEEIEQIGQLPFITYTDMRYMTSGVTAFRRMDQGIDYYDYTNICVVEADVKFYNGESRTFVASNIELIGGEAIDKSGFGSDIYIKGEATHVLTEDTTMFYWRDNVRAVNVATEHSLYDDEFLSSLQVGERYVFVLRYEDDTTSRDVDTYFLTDPFVYGQCEAVYPLAGEPENYLETEKFAPLREYIEIIETDQYTLDVVYTKNMNSIRYFADKTIGVAEGRALTIEDTENMNNVCVVSHTFAKEYGLSVGDTITVELGNKLFTHNRAVGAVSAVKGRTSSAYTETELEIVGIFKDTRNKYMGTPSKDVAWSYSINTVFVPQHLLNVEEGELEKHAFHFGEVSFVVENAWDIATFEEGVLPQIKDAGYTVYFEDGGFNGQSASFSEMERIAAVKIAVLLFAVILVTLFVAVLYIIGRRKDYAIMRLLGTPKNTSARAVILPLAAITVTAVIIGSVLAYIHTVNNIADSQYVALLGEYTVDVNVSPWIMLLCVVGEIATVLVLAYVMISIISRKSPLELMQAGVKGKAKRADAAVVVNIGKITAPAEWIPIERITGDGKSRRGKFVWYYVLRHIKRTSGKAMLFVLVAVLLLNVLGQILILKASYTETFENTEVVSSFAGLLNLRYIEKLQKSGYVEDVYYCHKSLVDIDRVATHGLTVVFCNDIDLYGERENINNIQVTWLEGYDKNSTHELNSIILVGQKLMEERGYRLGDTIKLAGFGYYGRVLEDTINIFRTTTLNGNSYTEEEIVELEKERIEERYALHSDDFVIVGSVTDDNGKCDNLLFTPGSPDTSYNYGALIIPPYVSATLIDNWKADEYREYALELIGAKGTNEIAFIMDTTKIENIRNNIELLNTLYPIMIAAVMVIGAFLCGMLIVQTSKEIAVMRVLGTSKRRVRAIIVLEYMLLCALGVVISAAVLVIRGVFGEMIWVMLVYAAVILLASLAASVLASRKNVLELLQTKE